MCSTGASTLGKGRSLAGLTGFKGYPLGLFMTAGKGYSMLALQLGGVVHHSIPGLFLGVMGRTDYVTGNPVCGLGSTEKVHHVSISWHSIRKLLLGGHGYGGFWRHIGQGLRLGSYSILHTQA